MNRGALILLSLLLALGPAVATEEGGFGFNGTPPEPVGDASELVTSGLIEYLDAAKLASVNPQNRESSRSYFNTHYLGSSAAEGQSVGWTGSHASCAPGTTSSTFRNAVLTRINYFRGMAGVGSSVAFDSTYSAKAQKAALIMSANNSLSHSPNASWTCYSAEGAEAAGKSNLHIHWGQYADPVTSYMMDSGNNNAQVGHRRWLLYPQTQYMGTGDVPETGSKGAANAIWVQDSNIWGARPSTRETYVAWPPPGYVPYQVVFARWSFSIRNANFANASVSMTQNGSPISVTIDARISNANSAPENSIVWRPFNLASDYDWPKPPSDTVYVVNINNVVVGGTPQNFSYTVRVFDPATGGGTTTGPWGGSDAGGGWKWSSWFGYYLEVNSNWIWHQQHEYLYSSSTSSSSIWFWYPDLNTWCWTSSSTYPYIWTMADGWYWYKKGSANPRWFMWLTNYQWYGMY